MKKKNLFLSLMAGVALLGSCTREALSTSPDGYAVVPEGAIVFDTRVSGTKAVTETTASTLQTQGFNVYGLAVTTPLEGDPTFEEYMDNVSVSNHDGVYYGSTTYYWPAGKTMDFYCANAGKEISSSDGAATLAYTLDANREYDLVAAKSIGASSGTVSLTFAHLLSQLQLKVLGLDENATYTLTSLSVTAPTVGTYAFSRDGSDSWTSLGTDAAYSVYSGAGQAVSTSSAANVGTTMAFFPGTATVRAQWTCKVDDQVIGTYDNTALVTLSKGKVNTVTLKLPNASAEPIRFSMSVNAWTDAEDAEVQMGPSATIAVSAAAEETVTLPQMTLSSGTTLVIDWKDGTTDTYEYGVSRTVLNDGTVTPSHTYSEAIGDRVSLFVSGGEVTITTETPEDVTVVDGDAVDIIVPVIDYIVFTSASVGNSLRITDDGLSFAEFYYSFDNVNYITLPCNTNIAFDDKIYIKGKSEYRTLCYTEEDMNPERYHFEISQPVTVSGDIMALLDYENYDSVSMGVYAFAYTFSGTPITDASGLLLPTSLSDHCFYRLFANCSNLVVTPAFSNVTFASECYKEMFCGCTSLTSTPLLPMTTLYNCCYSGMFKGCTSLNTVSGLPATTLAAGCYTSMFEGCTSLATAPSLPTTTLYSYCYSGMFKGCTSLNTVSGLPATTLAAGCYSSMFEGCTALESAPALPATVLAYNCYENMFKGCTSLTTPSSLLATTLRDNCYLGMFEGCTSLATAPIVSGTNAPEGCCAFMFKDCTALTESPILRASSVYEAMESYNPYHQMFKGCTNLTKVTCLATSFDIGGSWLNDISASGTFYKKPSADCWVVGTNIPSGWTIQDYTE